MTSIDHQVQDGGVELPAVGATQPQLLGEREGHVNGGAHGLLEQWHETGDELIRITRLDSQLLPAREGKVVVWSNQATSFAGLIKATGGSVGGNGGFAEVSSHGVLDFHGSAD